MSTFTYEIFFTGAEDPRDNCIIIGEDEGPVLFEFKTDSSRTTVLSDLRPIAAFDWVNESELGVAEIKDRKVPMAHLVMASPNPNARSFVSANGTLYEWRRTYHEHGPGSYELWAAPNTRVAIFQKFAYPTPVGPSHGTLRYNFYDHFFLLEALMTLNLNRWLDMNMGT